MDRSVYTIFIQVDMFLIPSLLFRAKGTKWQIIVKSNLHLFMNCQGRISANLNQQGNSVNISSEDLNQKAKFFDSKANP
ncbi:hypothetical protein A4A49_10660 [Nicotiana attenuata]|uniref:Uncharacterized protein n=1 Tax=Nicotiana attenuata TaxID=49451 RepID=A0A1J6HU83_NICAT|nr:hypothetical protein A4A49_10660 [Nicotiana attenuata]